MESRTIWLSPSKLEVALDCLYKFDRLYGGHGQQGIRPQPPAAPAVAGGDAQEDTAEGNVDGQAAKSALEGAGEAPNATADAPPRSNNLIIGIAAHAVLAKLFVPCTEANKNAIEHGAPEWEDYLKSLVSANWPYEARAEQDEVRAAQDMVFNLIKYAYPKLKPVGDVLGAETYISCTTPVNGCHVHLTCRADRIELHEDGTLELLDYKKNANGSVLSPRLLAAHLPTYLYFLASWHRYRGHPRVRNIVVSQFNILSLQKSVANYDQAQIISNRQALRHYVQAMAHGPYSPTTGPACRWCPLRPECPAWQDSQLDLNGLDDFDEWRHRDQLAS